VHPPVDADREARQAPERGDVLVLLAHRLAQHVDLDVARLLGEGGRGYVLALVGVQRPEQPHREGSRRSQPCARRDVGDAHDLLRAPHRVQAQRLPDQGVLDVGDPRDPLHRRVLDDVVVGERVVDRYVDILVHGGRDDVAAVAPVVGGKVGTAASDGDPQRRTRDEHMAPGS
jgi:hypothetical protein